jgi:hypothetical protein
MGELVGPLVLLGAAALVAGSAVAAVVVLVLLARRGVAAGRRLGEPAAARAEVAGLLPWHDGAWGELAARWEGRLAQTIGYIGAEGRCRSLRTPGGALFVFAIRRDRGSGPLDGWTSDRHVHIDLSPRGAQVAVDGRRLGAVLPDGALVDPSGLPIGRRARPRPGRGGHREYPVILRGRELASLRTVVDGPTDRPLVARLAPARTADDDTWLLALCVLEVGNDGSALARSNRRQ